MEENSERFIRALLHDLANTLAGIRGLVDLNRPGQPFSPRDRDRLEAVLDEGQALLERGRNLALDTLPEALLEPEAVWRDRLEAALMPLATLYRCRFDLTVQGQPEWNQWPGSLLRGYAQALTRQVLPGVRVERVAIRCQAGPAGWRLEWRPAAGVPENLGNVPEGRPLDVGCRWLRCAGAALGVSLSWDEGVLTAAVPRCPPGR